MKTYRVYGYNYDDDKMSIVVMAEDEEKARELVEDDFYYGTTRAIEITRDINETDESKRIREIQDWGGADETRKIQRHDKTGRDGL